MARAIDADRLAEGLKLHRQPTDQKHETDRQWAVGYNAGLERALYSITYAPTFIPPNEPLTLEHLRASPHGKIKDSTLQSICNRANEIACRPPEGEEDT